MVWAINGHQFQVVYLLIYLFFFQMKFWDPQAMIWMICWYPPFLRSTNISHEKSPPAASRAACRSCSSCCFSSCQFLPLCSCHASTKLAHPPIGHDGFMGENHTVSFMGQKYDFFLENDVFVLLVLYFQTSSVFWQYWAMEADVWT